MICAHQDLCLQVWGGFSGSASLRGKQQSRADAERRTLSQFIARVLERYLEESGKPSRRSPAKK
jgi:hypothetical protein